MGQQVTVTVEPIELVINGTSIQMQGDPSASPEWGAILDVPISYGTQEERDSMAELLTANLSAMTETDEDAALLKSLGLGPVTLKKAAEGYVQAVTGFPTQPAKNSGKR
jgi:hypothetical protein